VFRFYFIAACVFIADHAVKWLVSTNMKIGQEVLLIPGVLGLASVRNSGAAFGILRFLSSRRGHDSSSFSRLPRI